MKAYREAFETVLCALCFRQSPIRRFDVGGGRGVGVIGVLDFGSVLFSWPRPL